MNCIDKVSQNIDRAACENEIYQGYEQTGYGMLRSDIASYTEADGVVSAITLAEGARAFKIYTPVKSPFNGSQVEMNAGDVSNKFNHTVAFIILNDGSAIAKNVIEPLANGEYVFVMERKWKNDANEKFEIIGLKAGAKASAIVRNANDDATDGGWSVTMVETNSTKAGMYVKVASDTTGATTRTMLEGLCYTA